jgi:hypothetical protein
MTKKELEFTESKSNKTIDEIYNFSTEAFSGLSEEWSVDGLKKQVKEGWQLYSVKFEGEVVAAVLTKEDADMLLTKNTTIKINYQGNGFLTYDQRLV